MVLIPSSARDLLAASFRDAANAASGFDGSNVRLGELPPGGPAGFVLEADAGSGGQWDVRLEIPEGVHLVAHGHSAAFWSDEVQFGELHLESTTAARLSVEAGPGGRRLALAGHGGGVRIRLQLDRFLLKDRGIGRPGMNWLRHDSGRSFNYLLDRAEGANRSDGSSAGKLLVVFSAIGAEHDFTFNYRASLEQSRLSKAFIMDDFGRQGSYYWMDHGDDSIFHETQGLLAKLVEDLGVALEDVIFAGSSKGATAALLHGVTLGVGKVVLGAPQYRVGDYLFHAAPQILDFMTGGATEEHRRFLNDRAREILANGHRSTAIRVAVGSADHHLASHVEPLLDDARAAGYEPASLVLPGLPHSEIGQVFKHLLSAEVADFEQGSGQEPLPYALTRQPGSVTLQCWPGNGETLAVHLFGKAGILEQRPPSGDTDFIFPLSDDEGQVRARVFRRSVPGSAVRAFTTHWV
ncbi:hypothetical protein [Arthrobacter sp. R-11]|uniref:hypothetical protein n=1 Tax=Arthrobacter sp. R-11 TaxID=3404053 RepID=UPI003CED92E5